MSWSSEELAYAAGLIDGEGTIQLGRRWKTGQLQTVAVRVSNTDERMIAWLQSRFPGHVALHRQVNVRAKPLYRWSVSAVRAETFLRAIRPWLVTKGGQADLALQFRATTLPLGVHPLPVAVVEEREEIKRQLDVLNRRGV